LIPKASRSDWRLPKLVPLEEAVRRHLHDGDTVFVGGFGQCIPFAIGHEIVRQGLKNLVLCRSGADILFDLLIAAGCVAKVIVGYLGNPGIGLAHAFRRAAEAGTIEVEDWTNFAMVLRLHAAALGVPFLPAAVKVRTVTCPYSGEELSAIPALQPDVALLHAQCADADGNLQLFGLPGDSVEGALASRKVIATVEEIVAPETIRQRPDRTVVPGFRVEAVSHVPFGAYPAYVDGYYGRDDRAYEEWDALARDPAALGDWIEAVRATPDFASYLEMVGPARLQSLADAFGRDAR
jgi:glutaconate CoA-transferase subunit A